MKKAVLSLGKTLSKSEQKTINGGYTPCDGSGVEHPECNPTQSLVCINDPYFGWVYDCV